MHTPYIKRQTKAMYLVDSGCCACMIANATAQKIPGATNTTSANHNLFLNKLLLSLALKKPGMRQMKGTVLPAVPLIRRVHCCSIKVHLFSPFPAHQCGYSSAEQKNAGRFGS